MPSKDRLVDLATLLLAVETALLLPALAWLLRHPLPSPAAPAEPVPGEEGGPAAEGGPSGTGLAPAAPSPGLPPQQRSIPSFPSEEEALTDYLERLARSYDLALLLQGGPGVDELRELLERAARCPGFSSCPPLHQLQLGLVEAGRPVPVEPGWAGSPPRSERARLLDTLSLLVSELRAAGLELGPAERDALSDALDCPSLDCPAARLVSEQLERRLGRSAPSLRPLPSPSGAASPP